jgi:hypothetical protein
MRRRPGLVAYAAHAPERRLRRQHLLHVFAVEPGLRHHRHREAVPIGDALDPTGLPCRVRRIPLRLHIDRSNHIECRRVPSVVLRKVVRADCPVVSVAERDGRLVAQPRMIVVLQIPEVMVGIDDGYVPCA